MQAFLQQVVNGLTIGSVYALVALGYTMVFGVLKIVNFAHGELFMLGAYLGFTAAVTWTGVARTATGLILFTLGASLVVAAVGLLVERVAYRPLRRSSRLATVVSALGVSIFLQNAVMLLYGPNYQVYPEGLVSDRAWQVFGVEITLMRAAILATSLALMAGLYFFVMRTRIGMATRAAAIDQDTARLMGIDVDAIIRLIFFLGPLLGAVAGVLVGLFYRQINFTMGWTYGMKAFTAAILGGIGNIPGAMVGGLLLGILETLGAGYVSAAWKDALAFFILIGILILRPTGLLGERVAEKV